MRTWFKNFYTFFPVQLFILHFRKYQVLLLFWYVLFSTVNSSFLKYYGADALFFAPEYLNTVGILGAFIVGIAIGVFFMSWHITTFILHSRRFKFLATTTNPFLKYCLNNSILPAIFLIFYFVKLYRYDDYRELMSLGEIILLMLGILAGGATLILLSFVYFFGADKTISKRVAAIVSNPDQFKKIFLGKKLGMDFFALPVNFYLTGRLKIKKTRSVSHYRDDFIESIFKRHHLAAIGSILLAFLFLILVGFFLDKPFFEMPAAASVFIFFALMIALIGALAYFLQSWSLPAAIVLLLFLNFLFEKGYIDPRNKAYGLDYPKNEQRPRYNPGSLNALCTPEKLHSDKQQMVALLNLWKARQDSAKPLMVFINVSGGGLRSSAFTMHALQKMDSMLQGKLMQKTFMISGASGGMLAATYYRELYRRNVHGDSILLYSPQYLNNITGDLLNSVFSSMMARDLMGSSLKFTVGKNKYIKDRGYAFEKKLSENTNHILNVQLKDFKSDEAQAKVPLLLFNAVVKGDGKKMVLSTQPMSFMMKPFALQQDTSISPDAVDFAALFKNQQPMNLRLLSALRMNATFPYVLPNVWLPASPVIDVMDAGLRDNFGQEATLRFLDNFKEWIELNTRGVLVIQIRDRNTSNWTPPFEPRTATDVLVSPATMLQNNWFRMQDYYQDTDFAYFKNSFGALLTKITVMYIPQKPDNKVALNFHLTAREKRDIIESFDTPNSMQTLKQIVEILQ